MSHQTSWSGEAERQEALASPVTAAVAGPAEEGGNAQSDALQHDFEAAEWLAEHERMHLHGWADAALLDEDTETLRFLAREAEH